MKISRALLVSAFITAIALVVAGSVVSAVIARQESTAREAEYAQLIEQANQQIDQANANLTQMQNQLAATQPVAQVAQAGAGIPASAQITADQAAKIAQTVADPQQSLQKTPELVDYQGSTAYEAPFDNGAVYVDANSGEVLFNGTVPMKIDAQLAAKVAADYLGDKNVLSVDMITFRGQQLFRVIFKSGTMVYLDETGQITYINKGTVVMADASSDDDGGGSAAPHKTEHHDDDDEHEDDD